MNPKFASFLSNVGCVQNFTRTQCKRELKKELWVTMSHVKKDVFRLVASVGQRKKKLTPTLVTRRKTSFFISLPSSQLTIFLISIYSGSCSCSVFIIMRVKLRRELKRTNTFQLDFCPPSHSFHLHKIILSYFQPIAYYHA